MRRSELPTNMQEETVHREKQYKEAATLLKSNISSKT